MSEERVGDQWTRRTRIIRTIVGLLVAPVAGAIVATILIVPVAQFLNGVSTGMDLRNTVILLQSAAVIGASLGWPAAFLVGWPIHAGLLQRRVFRTDHYVVLGALIALATFITLGLLGAIRYLFGWQLLIVAFAFLIAGVIGGLIFWLIRRPDRDVHPGRQSAPTGDVGS